MAGVRVISTSTIHGAETQNDSATQEIELTPWDLQLLLVDPVQKGLLFRNPSPKGSELIQHLKSSLSSTLQFFAPLAGRLKIVEHHDNTSSVSIVCNNAGALFVHAVADNCTVSDILKPVYTPRIVHSFFALNKVRNYEGTSKPLLAVQVTELLGGIFIGCSINHLVVDGTSFWHFFNSWAEISRGLGHLSKPPTLERWFLDDGGNICHPIRIPFSFRDEKLQHDEHDIDRFDVSKFQLERVFHFTPEKIAQLKAKANAEGDGSGSKRISCLQALLTHLWRGIVRNQQLDPQKEVNYRVLIGARGRIKQLADNYFGNALQDGTVTMKASELVEGGLGNAAMEMNKMITLHDEEKLKSHYKSWLQNPRLVTESSFAGNALVTSSSPRFDVYGNDFGWGKPVAVRSGLGNKTHGKITVFAGLEAGSIDIEVCLPFQTLEAMGNDLEFMDAVST